MNEKERINKKFIAWIPGSYSDYEMGIIRIGRTYFPAWTAFVLLMVMVVGSVLFGLFSVEYGGLDPVVGWLPGMIVAGGIGLYWFIRGLVALPRGVRNMTKNARENAQRRGY